MSLVVEEISTITAKGQTTVPKAVRRALGVDYGGKIAFRVNNGAVTVVRADEIEDSTIEAFLGFLGEDLKRHPEAVKALSPDLAMRIADLIKSVDDDLDEPIDGKSLPTD
jgi:antitoxin PrlF